MIEVSGMTKYYGPAANRFTVVDAVSFYVAPGTVFGLLGPNGAGKSTTIKMLTTLSRPDAGSCVIDGIDVAAAPMEIKKRIGVVPQENNLDRELSAWENLQIYGMLHRVVHLPEKINQALKAVSLLGKKDVVVSHFSGGMQRRLLIARALLTEPAVLFLDEPTIGLDPQIRRQLWDIIRKCRRAGRTVMLTTHYIEEAEALCDMIGIIASGRMIALDTPESFKKTVGEYVIDYPDGDGDLRQVMCRSREEAHEQAKSLPNGVTIRRSNLEDVFIKLTGEKDRITGWYPIFLREMLLFKRKLFKLGYLFSAMVVPVIYLMTFGLGVGRSMQMQGTDYLTFLIPGLVAMSSMTNSYTWVASALNLNRLYFKTFQVLVQAPINPSSIMIGEVLAGMAKGLFASILIIAVGLLAAPKFHISWILFLTLLLNCFLFSCLGVIVGMITKSHEDTSTYNNFLIMPMSFFSGTFFPVSRMPKILQEVISIFPLTHTNILIRKSALDSEGIVSLAILIAYTIAFFFLGSRLIRQYSE